MLRRWENTILYIILMVAMVTACCIYIEDKTIVFLALLAIVQVSRRFIPRIIAEFRYKEE